jgi:putative transposase
VALDMPVQSQCDMRVAKSLLQKLPKRKKCRASRITITSKVPSYGAAKRKVMFGVEYRPHNDLNNGAQNSHQSTRRPERQMKRFLSAYDQIANFFPEGKSKREIIRCLKRFVAREIFGYLCRRLEAICPAQIDA